MNTKILTAGCDEMKQVLKLLGLPENCEVFTVYSEDGIIKIDLTMYAHTKVESSGT